MHFLLCTIDGKDVKVHFGLETVRNHNYTDHHHDLTTITMILLQFLLTNYLISLLPSLTTILLPFDFTFTNYLVKKTTYYQSLNNNSF